MQPELGSQEAVTATGRATVRPWTATYEATLSADGTRFLNGKWSGGPAIPAPGRRTIWAGPSAEGPRGLGPGNFMGAAILNRADATGTASQYSEMSLFGFQPAAIPDF
jgi:hypothetical protein